MKLQQLECLIAVVDHGSIRGAARQLHLSQAAVSKAMRTLEDEAGVALLLRGSRGAEPTDAGQRLLARARIVTRQMSLAREDFQQASGGDYGRLCVAVTPFVSLRMLGEAFNWFRKRYQKVQIEIVDGLIARVLPRMREGLVDLGVVLTDAGEELGGEFSAEHILRVRSNVVVRATHPLIQDFSPEALIRHDWLLTRPLTGDRKSRIHAMFEHAGMVVPSNFVICDGLQALALLRETNVISLMPEPELNLPETRGIVPLLHCGLQPNDMVLTLISRSDVPLTPAAQYFAHCVVEVCRKTLDNDHPTQTSPPRPMPGQA